MLLKTPINTFFISFNFYHMPHDSNSTRWLIDSGQKLQLSWSGTYLIIRCFLHSMQHVWNIISAKHPFLISSIHSKIKSLSTFYIGGLNAIAPRPISFFLKFPVPMFRSITAEDLNNLNVDLWGSDHSWILVQIIFLYVNIVQHRPLETHLTPHPPHPTPTPTPHPHGAPALERS